MSESTEATLVVVPGPKGPRVHRVTCKRAILTEGHSYGADPSDVDAQSCGSCKPGKARTDADEALAAETPDAIVVTDADTMTARRKAATAEAKALKAWEKAGSDGDRPATPNLDAMNAEYEGENPKVKVPRSARQAPREVTATTTLASGKLAPGALQAAVADHVATLPAGDDITPGQVARHLERSSGAVANAMAKMAEAGTLKALAGSPRRYRRVTTQAAEAA
jgi:O6-methylguanine-DNA--protein-cysteine methyltransferase